MEKIHVKASTKEYDVTVGANLDYGGLLKKLHTPCKLMVVSDDTVFSLYGNNTIKSLRNAGFETYTYIFPHGETSKTLAVAEKLMIQMVDEGITKTDLLVALGGGVVGDLTGLVAGIFLRGMDFVQLPTTLLAAVDSSVGGKTAVDLPNGKNMVGAFHQPIAVFCDVNSFRTLPEETYAQGMAEAIKYGLIQDASLFEKFEKHSVSDEDIVLRSVEIKAEVVAKDEFDKGPRHTLNFGHTLGHAVETLSGYGIGHGQGVAIGMAVLSAAFLPEEEAKRVLSVIRDYKLPVRTDFDLHELAMQAKADKKRHGDFIRVVLPKTIGEVYLKDVTCEEWEAILRDGMEKLDSYVN